MGEILNYKESKAVNYSLLSSLIASPKEAKAMIDGEDKSSSGFELGNIVDHLLTSDEPVYNKFAVVRNKPSGGMLALADEYVRLASDPLLTSPSNIVILQARDNVNYDSRLKDETVIKKFYEGCSDYVETMQSAQAEGKSVISADTLEFAENLITSAHYEPTTEYYLDSRNFTKQFKQLELFAELWGIECKGKPDIVDVDENEKIVYIVDVKTYSGNFISNFWKYHYYLQTPFYGELFKKNYSEYADYEYKYINVTIDTTGANKPEVYELCDDLVDWVLDRDILDGEAEKTTYFMDVLYPKYNKIPSIPELIIELKWHIQNDSWEHKFRYYELGKNIIG